MPPDFWQQYYSMMFCNLLDGSLLSKVTGKFCGIEFEKIWRFNDIQYLRDEEKRLISIEYRLDRRGLVLITFSLFAGLSLFIYIFSTTLDFNATWTKAEWGAVVVATFFVVLGIRLAYSLLLCLRDAFLMTSVVFTKEGLILNRRSRNAFIQDWANLERISSSQCIMSFKDKTKVALSWTFWYAEYPNHRSAFVEIVGNILDKKRVRGGLMDLVNGNKN